MPPNNESPWSFNQPVLLNKSRRTSSVLVWTLAGGTLFAAGWAFPAPLPPTVAVQGKLQPASGVQAIEASVPSRESSTTSRLWKANGSLGVTYCCALIPEMPTLGSVQPNATGTALRIRSRSTASCLVNNPPRALAQTNGPCSAVSARPTTAAWPLNKPRSAAVKFGSLDCANRSAPQKWSPSVMKPCNGMEPAASYR